jgi:phenylpropionate dioxygenase-like ring-hydroxylating dioxygenase large terminal subunit
MVQRTAAPIDPALLERVLQPFDHALTLPGEAYASPAVFEWETRHFFEGSWLCIGRSVDLQAAGDQRAVAVGDRAFLLIRGDDGVLRSFYNSCRHRGHELLRPGERNNARYVKCPYHAWVYSLEGRLKAAPRFEEFAKLESFRKDDYPLVGLATAEWHGWAFVNLSGDAPPFDEHIGNLGIAVDDYLPATLTQMASHEYVVEANWKIIVENYLECYHCSNIHPELCEVTPPESGDVPYAAMPTGVWTGGPMTLREGAETMSLDGRSGGVRIPSVPVERDREIGYAAVFPNLLISPHPDYVMTHRLVPLTPRRTWVECTWLFPREAAERDGFSADYAAEFWDLTNREDWDACESVQRSVNTGGYHQGPVSSWEVGVFDAMEVVARGYLEGRLSPPSSSYAQMLGF